MSQQHEDCEFRLVERPEELGVGWVVHRVTRAQKMVEYVCEVVDPTLEKRMSNGNYINPSERCIRLTKSRRISVPMFLMKRSRDATVHDLSEKAKWAEQERVSMYKDKYTAERDKKDVESKLVAAKNRIEELASLMEELRSRSLEDSKILKRYEADIGKLRDHLGKERFNLILGEIK